MKSYEHSASFSKLKNITERISKNLTTLEYLHTLDMFLWQALEPIHAECPSLFHNYVAKIVARQTRKASMRFTSDDRSKLPIHLFNMVTTKDPKRAHEFAKAMYINRGLLFGFITLFLKKTERYERLHSTFDLDPIVRNSEIYNIERSLGLRSGGTLYSAIQQTKFWYDLQGYDPGEVHATRVDACEVNVQGFQPLRTTQRRDPDLPDCGLTRYRQV
jgi:hypothetical protein